MASAACHIYIGKQREKHYLPYHADQNSLGISYHIGKRFDTQLCSQQKHLPASNPDETILTCLARLNKHTSKSLQDIIKHYIIES